MWNGRAFKLCDEKFAGRNWEILARARPVLIALMAVLVFSYLSIP
jgi:hypothetical protein